MALARGMPQVNAGPTGVSTGAGWDEMFATLPRLKVAAYLSGCGQADFAALAAATQLSPPTLSKTATILESAGYLRIRKGHVGRRPRTWLALTDEGRAAFQAHLDAVHALTAAGAGDASGDMVADQQA
jgi:DNA-binding MarR family transcriptional regulator